MKGREEREGRPRARTCQPSLLVAATCRLLDQYSRPERADLPGLLGSPPYSRGPRGTSPLRNIPRHTAGRLSHPTPLETGIENKILRQNRKRTRRTTSPGQFFRSALGRTVSVE